MKSCSLIFITIVIIVIPLASCEKNSRCPNYYDHYTEEHYWSDAIARNDASEYYVDYLIDSTYENCLRYKNALLEQIAAIEKEKDCTTEAGFGDLIQWELDDTWAIHDMLPCK